MLKKSLWLNWFCLCLAFLLNSCSSGFSYLKDEHPLQWTKVSTEKMPVEVINFFSDTLRSVKMITDLDGTHQVSDTLVSKGSEYSFKWLNLHKRKPYYRILMNGQKYVTGKGSFKAPMVIYQNFIYMNRSNRIRGRLFNLEDLDIYSAELKY